MSETGFTKGPWSVGIYKWGWLLRSPVEDCQICKADFEPECLPETHERQKADARLIAAAPTLYLALDRLLNDSMFKDHPEASQMAIDALAKARGEA